MNDAGYLGALARTSYRALLGTRCFRLTPTCGAVGVSDVRDRIERIYVINLDRHGERWHRMGRELRAIKDCSGKPLFELTRRFSAVDARQLDGSADLDVVQRKYFLADHLRVEPHPQLMGDERAKTQRIEMTRQEIAVALSHIQVWRLVAESDLPYTLVLEDDVYFRRDFAKRLTRAWNELVERQTDHDLFDVLYVSYKEVLTGADKEPASTELFRPLHGLWQLSGYVVSARGAKRLLGALPVRGPVDLWINHQFPSLDVLATQRSLVKQRSDVRSSNVYSILPVLSQVGVLTREKPLLPKARKLAGPVFAFGEPGTGLTSLAMALSMLEYRCASDVTDLPTTERRRLFEGSGRRVFDAYVNIGSLEPDDYVELARLYPGARFVLTDGLEADCIDLNGSNAERSSSDHQLASYAALVEKLNAFPRRVIVLREQDQDKWERLRAFLDREYPSDRYPDLEDLGQRRLIERNRTTGNEPPCLRRLRSDSSPWIARTKDWHGIAVSEDSDHPSIRGGERHRFEGVESDHWMLRDDTFPSNLALFVRENYSIERGLPRLTLREQQTAVRGFTSAAICTRHAYLYGKFSAELRPANASGLITGVFLHRNSPRQEIDIEFLGKDTRRILVNVYYNPGADGARVEYGYRGTPALLDLGFDASEEFHRYEIEWGAASIRWLVDGRLVHERVNWDPTPIPHLPMQFNVNLWHSRSEELAGRLARGALPAHTEVLAAEIYSEGDTPSGSLVRDRSLSTPFSVRAR